MLIIALSEEEKPARTGGIFFFLRKSRSPAPVLSRQGIDKNIDKPAYLWDVYGCNPAAKVSP